MWDNCARIVSQMHYGLGVEYGIVCCRVVNGDVVNDIQRVYLKVPASR